MCKCQNHGKAKVCTQCNVRRQFADGLGAAAPCTAALASTASQRPINAAASAVHASFLAVGGGMITMPDSSHVAGGFPRSPERKELELKNRALER